MIYSKNNIMTRALVYQNPQLARGQHDPGATVIYQPADGNLVSFKGNTVFPSLKVTHS
jgi:hypothetical protein